MPEDASLDDFLESADEEDDDEEDTDEAEQAVAAEPEADSTSEPSAQAERDHDDEAPTTDDDDASVTPATTTYAWSDEGTTCDECGEPAERRWQQDGALVCPECKVW